jgi:molybdopterin-guanine dinucleotide biosynthesis protein
MTRPFIIGIGGTCSNSGKTTLGVLLLRHLTTTCSREQPGVQCVPGGSPSAESCTPCASRGRWGAVKYTKTDLYSSLVDDKDILSLKDKDTGRFIEAGAEQVVWVKAPPRALEEILPLAMDRLLHLDGLIVEGNSAIEFLEPDIVIFIFGNRKERWKTGLDRLVRISDIIIYENESELPDLAKTKRLFLSDRGGVYGAQELIAVISDLIHERKAEGRTYENGCRQETGLRRRKETR